MRWVFSFLAKILSNRRFEVLVLWRLIYSILLQTLAFELVLLLIKDVLVVLEEKLIIFLIGLKIFSLLFDVFYHKTDRFL